MIRSNQNIRSENISYSFLIGKKQTWVIIVCLIFIIVLTFFPSLTNDFQMECDDQWMLLNHPMLLDQSLENIWYYFTHFDRGQYFPLNQLYYMGIYRLFGFTPEAFHAGSFLLHLVNSGLVFILIWQWMKWIITSVNTNAILGLVALITVVFAVHPLQVEAVAWISASKVLLYGTFTLVGLIGYLEYKRSGNILIFILVFLCYALSLMSKEQAILFPLNLVLFDFILHTYQKVRFSRKVILEKIPFFLLAFLFWYWSIQNDLGAWNVVGAYPPDQRLVFGSYSLLIYIFRFLMPVNLLYFYGFPIVIGESIPLVYYIYVLLAVLFVLYLADLYRQGKYIPFYGLMFFLINMLLVLHILPMPREMITADRYMYIGIVGLSIWAVWGISRMLQKFHEVGWIKYGIWSMILVVLIGYTVYSNVLTRKWENSDTIKQEVREYLEPSMKNIPEE